MEKANNVLWTGGWDSTFRVIQLFRLGATIQPIHVLDHNRQSSKKELEVVKELALKIPLQYKASKGKILPLDVIYRKNIPSNLFLKLLHKKLKTKHGIGKQYYWLGSLAKQRKYKSLEVSLHKEDMHKFFSEDQMIEINDERLGLNCRINTKKVNFRKKYIFKNMMFPLMTISKPQMKIVAEENNFIDLMELTWFCHKSKERPCGECNPCKQYIRDGFGYRVK